jgi:hypothetical protein
VATTTRARRTRGPRTPNERATDAAQRTATLFEKLPSQYMTDGVLKPLAVLLRWEATGGSRHPAREDAARALVALFDHWGYLSRVKTWEVFPPFSGRPEQVNPKVDRMPGNLEKLEEVVEGLAARVLPPKRPMLKLIDDRDA